MRSRACLALAFALTVACAGARAVRADGGIDVAAEAGTDVSAQTYQTQLRVRADATYWLWNDIGLTTVLGTGQLRGDTLYHGGAGATARVWLSNTFALRATFGAMFYDLTLQDGAAGTPMGPFLDGGADYAVTPSILATLIVSANYGALSGIAGGHPLFVDFLAGARLRF